MKVEPGNILKLFLNFSNFEPQYSYRLYSYKKKECIKLLSDVLLHYNRKCKLLHSCMIQKIVKYDWNIFFKYLGEVTTLVLKNNLRMILGSKSEK